MPASQSEYCGAERRQREREIERASEIDREIESERKKSQTAGNFFALPVTVSV